jgi:protein transport protein SEC23
MKPLVEKTGGYVVVHEEFNSNVFKDSYKKFFELDQNNCLKMAFDSKIDVIVSKDLRICGAIGPCTSLKKGGPMVIF